ncbi:MAG: transglutaminase-like domain-containing protein [Bacteroidota bacterium]|nr:transglutaminase-like domain-containing protein [Bacteroidota bacterium]
MKKLSLILIVGLLVIGINSCNKNQDSTSIDKKFEETKKIAKHRNNDLFGIFDTDLNKQETEYLKFLYAYMPLNDLADYDGVFFLNHVKTSIKIKNELEWTSKIPEDIYKHFILPYRINNENLDTSRIVFYNELKNRIKGMSMYDAAIEVNHWCHEKVEYRSADGRTSSPLQTMKTAFGRCGEESTFAVAAMRAVCIPARQVYTPRWAHSDDNHAWVEIWADGKWYFLGACEPQPVLNFGWFNEPASRAMLVHARVFGKYKGEEEINVSTSQYDDINVIERYAYTFKQFIKVIDTKGNAVENATIEYQLYNYAEFYPITKKSSDKNGISYLTTGLGELLIWVSNSSNYGFQKIIIGKKDTVAIVMDNPDFKDVHWELMPPPASDKTKIELTDEQINNNKISLQYEDSIRNAYVLSFIQKDVFIANHNENLWTYMEKSRGNYDEIINFIDANKDNEWTEPLLSVIADKDLRDTKAKILTDHLKNSMIYADDYSSEIFTKYILNPRIELEMVLAYKSFLLSKFDADFIKNVKKDPEILINWIKDSIQINNKRQAYNIPITPIGVYKLRVSNDRSRNLFFVATCRTFGIPARLEAGTLTAQYLFENKWVDVFFDDKPIQYKKFDITFNIINKELKFTPQYYHHFTIGRFENNRFNTLEFGEYQNIDEIKNIKLRTGTYRLITSNRLPTGRILVDIQFFNINSNETINLDFPQESIVLETQGSINRKKLSNSLNYDIDKAKNLQEESKIVIAIIQPDKEPSKHILNDIQIIKNDFEKTNSTIVFIIQKKDLPATFKTEDYPNLPERTIFKIVDKNPIELFDIKIKGNPKSFPKVMIANPDGDIFYLQEGYKIGVGNDLLKLL